MGLRDIFRKLDFALLPIGDNFTMGVDNAIIASDWYTDVLNIVSSKKSKSDELPIDSDKLDNKLKSDLLSISLLSINKSVTPK